MIRSCSRGDLADRADRLRRGQGAGRVVRQRDDHRADRPAGVRGGQDGRVQPGRVGDAALAGRGGHEPGAGADQPGLGGVADPAGPRYDDVRRRSPAAGRTAGTCCPGRRPRCPGSVGRSAPGPVAGRGGAQRGQPGDRPVAVAGGRRRQLVAQRGGTGRPASPKASGQHRLTARRRSSRASLAASVADTGTGWQGTSVARASWSRLQAWLSSERQRAEIGRAEGFLKLNIGSTSTRPGWMK